MKLSTLIAAGVIAAATMAPAMAGAQMQSHEQHDRTVVRTSSVHSDDGRHDDGMRDDHDRGMRGDHDRGMRDDGDRGMRHHARRVCRTEWRHHHRVRICRTIRR